MVIANCDSATDCTFEIRPNRSLTRRGMLVFFLLVSVAVFLLGIRFGLLGVWLVMPFTILEVVVLGTALYQFERATAYREVISLGQDGLLVRREARGLNILIIGLSSSLFLSSTHLFKRSVISNINAIK